MTAVNLAQLYEQCEPNTGVLVALECHADAICHELTRHGVQARQRNLRVWRKNARKASGDELCHIRIMPATAFAMKALHDLLEHKYPMIFVLKQIYQGNADTTVAMYEKGTGYRVDTYNLFRTKYMDMDQVSSVLREVMYQPQRIGQIIESHSRRITENDRNFYWDGQEALYKLRQLHDIVRPKSDPVDKISSSFTHF